MAREGKAEKSVYVETSVFSFYHDARPASAYRRSVTREWWKTQRRRYNVVTSQFAVEEVGEPGISRLAKGSGAGQNSRCA